MDCLTVPLCSEFSECKRFPATFSGGSIQNYGLWPALCKVRSLSIHAISSVRGAQYGKPRGLPRCRMEILIFAWLLALVGGQQCSVGLFERLIEQGLGRTVAVIMKYHGKLPLYKGIVVQTKFIPLTGMSSQMKQLLTSRRRCG